MLLRLNVNINMFVVSVLVCSTASKSAYNYVQRMFGYKLGSQVEICICSGSLKTPELAILMFSMS